MQDSLIVAAAYLTGSRRAGARTTRRRRRDEADGGATSRFSTGCANPRCGCGMIGGKGWPHSRLRE